MVVVEARIRRACTIVELVQHTEADPPRILRTPAVMERSLRHVAGATYEYRPHRRPFVGSCQGRNHRVTLGSSTYWTHADMTVIVAADNARFPEDRILDKPPRARRVALERDSHRWMGILPVSAVHSSDTSLHLDDNMGR